MIMVVTMLVTYTAAAMYLASFNPFTFTLRIENEKINAIISKTAL